MKLPETIKIGPYDFEVVPFEEDREYMGLYEVGPLIIRVKTTHQRQTVNNHLAT